MYSNRKYRILRSCKIIKYILFIFHCDIPLTIINVIMLLFFPNYFIKFRVVHCQQKTAMYNLNRLTTSPCFYILLLLLFNFLLTRKGFSWQDVFQTWIIISCIRIQQSYCWRLFLFFFCLVFSLLKYLYQHTHSLKIITKKTMLEHRRLTYKNWKIFNSH